MAKYPCSICGKSVGEHSHPKAEVSHMACAVEQAYSARDMDPSKGKYAEHYAESCRIRERQIAEGA